MMIFHHLGIATASMAEELQFYAMLGYTPSTPIFTDEAQGIRGQFICHQHTHTTSAPMLELLENLHGSGPLDACLQKGVKIYHMAYASTDIEEDAKNLAAQGAKVIQPVRTAVFFAKVCFLMLRNRQLIELVALRSYGE